MSAFNMEAFLNTQVNQALDTSLVPIPPGEYKAQVFKFSARKITKEGEDPRVVLDVLWEILDENAKKVTGQDKPIAKQGIFLDVDAKGALDMGKGKNVTLGQLREALGQNRAGRPWSFSMLKGAIAHVKVDNRPDSENPSIVYSDVKKVTSLSGAPASHKADKAA